MKNSFGRDVPRPAPCGIGGVKGHNMKGNYLCSLPARHCVPGKPPGIGDCVTMTEFVPNNGRDGRVEKS
jgi:hypothetical protein